MSNIRVGDWVEVRSKEEILANSGPIRAARRHALLVSNVTLLR